MSFYAAGSVMGESVSVVTKKLTELKALSDQYNATLTRVLGDISKISVEEVAPPKALNVPDVVVPSISVDNAPSYTAKGLTMPTMPTLKDLDSLLGDLDNFKLDLGAMPQAPNEIALNIPDMPSLSQTKVPDKPNFDMTVNLPTVPKLDIINMPSRPNVDMNVAFPDEPNISLPDMAKLFDIELPVFDEPVLPTFELIDVPKGMEFKADWWDFDDTAYQSDLYDDLLITARNMLDGTKMANFGLPQAVVQALFNKPRERLSRETKKQLQEVITTWASRGFSLPQGATQKAIDAIRDEEQLKVSELNTDIFVQATKEQIEQLKFAVTQGLALEQHTYNIFDGMVKRLFEVAKFNAEAQFKLFDYQVSLFNAQLDSYKVANEIYKTKLEGVLSKLTIYKAKIDAQTSISGLNAQLLEVYKSKLAGVQANVEVYKTLMAGVQTRVDVIKTQFDAYRTDLQAYTEQLNGEKIKFEAYKAQLEGESVKADIAKTQAGVYATQMDAYKTQVDSENKKLDAYEIAVKTEQTKASIYETNVRAYAERLKAYQNDGDLQLKQVQIKSDIAKAYTSKYLAEIDGYKANIQANLSEVQNHTETFKAQVEAWRSRVQMGISEAEMRSRWTDMQTRTSIAYSEMQMKEYETKVRNAQTSAQIALEQAKAIGGYAAQLASGAMSAAHVSASISASGSASDSTSKSVSESTSHNYSY